jgi:hypothetical protein
MAPRAAQDEGVIAAATVDLAYNIHRSQVKVAT